MQRLGDRRVQLATDLRISIEHHDCCKTTHATLPFATAGLPTGFRTTVNVLPGKNNDLESLMRVRSRLVERLVIFAQASHHCANKCADMRALFGAVSPVKAEANARTCTRVIETNLSKHTRRSHGPGRARGTVRRLHSCEVKRRQQVSSVDVFKAQHHGVRDTVRQRRQNSSWAFLGLQAPQEGFAIACHFFCPLRLLLDGQANRQRIRRCERRTLRAWSKTKLLTTPMHERP